MRKLLLIGAFALMVSNVSAKAEVATGPAKADITSYLATVTDTVIGGNTFYGKFSGDAANCLRIIYNALQ